MPNNVVLINWTEQGVKNARDTVNRYQQARSAFQGLGLQFQSVFWTIGRYDIVTVVEAPDDQSLSAALLQLAGQGNLRTETLRAFNEQEMQQVIERLG